jgi:predicted transcriptional regulator
MSIHGYNLEGDIKSKLDRLAQADDHPQIAIAESAVFATEAFLARLLEQRKFFRTDEYDDLINSTRELLGELVGRAVRKEEDDRVNGAFYRAIDAANARREA